METPLFRHPFTLIISGSTGTGKTQWLMRFITNIERLVTPPPRSILYCYGEMNNNTLSLTRQESTTTAGFGNDGRISIRTYNGVPPESLIKDEAERSEGRTLLVLDDLMTNLKASFLDTLFTRGSHNWGVSVALVTQHLFTKELRVARNNAHYLCLMRNPSGELQIRNLASQCFPAKLPYFMEAYRDATAEQFSYLIVDMHPSTDDRLRLRTQIFPQETCVVYISRV